MNERPERTPEEQEQIRRERRLKKRRKERRRRKIITFFVSLILLTLLAFGGFELAKKMMSQPASPDGSETTSALTGETVEIVIPEGATTQDIAKLLKDNDLIKSVFKFRLDSKMNDYDGTYRQGTYQVDKGLTSLEMMALFQKGSTVPDGIKVTVQEGLNTKEIAAKLEELEVVTAEEFINEANSGEFDYEFLKDLPAKTERMYRLEGYLFPDTYYFPEGTTAHDVVNQMLKRFDKELTEERNAAIAASGFTLDEIVTMASVIEKEIQVPEERAVASGVIRNRLKADMPLQMDATVLYAKGEVKEDVLEDDLTVDSPYNTYKNKGLPIGPIGNPGSASLEAAIFPDDNNYIYYVLEKKGSGNHIYTETYEEFLEAKAKYKAS